MLKIILSAAAVAALSLSTAFGQEPTVSAILDGPSSTPRSIVLHYPSAVDAQSITPDTFVIPGVQISRVSVSKEDPSTIQPPKEKPQPGEKPEHPESENGEYVILDLFGMAPPMRPDGFRGEGPRPEMKEGENASEDKEHGSAENGREQGNRPPMGPGFHPGGDMGMPGGMPMEGQRDDRRQEVPSRIMVQQIKDIGSVGGKTFKAWDKAIEVESFSKMGRPSPEEGENGFPEGEGPRRGPRPMNRMNPDKR